MDKWLESGEPRPVATRRQAAIEDLKLKNRFKDRLFVIVRAVAPEVMVYDFSKMTDADGQGSVKFMNQLDAATKGKGHLSSNTQLVIDQRLFVGYAAPIKIEEWLPSHLMSGDIIKIRGTATNLTLE
jgi:hypothetical protein